MIFYRNTVITQDVDLFGNLFTTLQAVFDFVHLTNPFTIDMSFDIFLKFRIFDVFRIRINRIHGRITFLVGAVLFKSIETTSYFLRIFRYRLFQVTTGRRYCTDESDRTSFTVTQHHISGTSVEVGDDRRQVHRECIRSRQLFHTIGHLAQCLCPTGSGVSHQQYFQSHASVIFRNRHSRIHRCFTGSYRHIRSIGDNNCTLHQLTSGVRVNQFRKLRKDFHNLIGTLTTGSDDYDIRFRLL